MAKCALQESNNKGIDQTAQPVCALTLIKNQSDMDICVVCLHFEKDARPKYRLPLSIVTKKHFDNI